jgi:D-alanyl-lipoteichoic acid acyltransferase DltB (MBOAT superfamily)
MNFVSFEFAVFLAVVYLLHWSCRHAGTRKLLLTIASYVFYAVWNWRFCFLMLFVTVNAFAAGQMLARATRPSRKAVLAASIGIDLAILGFFKYYDFFLSNVAAALADLGVSASQPVLRIILPVGISFYTFHAVSYVVDVYRGKVEPEPSFVNIALYISFFPQLIAGPIVRASFILPQIRHLRSFSPAQQATGVRLLLRGFIYKAVIADTLAQIADPVFAHVEHYDAHALVTATVAFYGQIYFDFAGYSSMAIGTARLFGYRFPPNFNYPYRAASVTEFWRRWHVAVILATRLPVHPARRQSGRHAFRLPQSDDHDAARRAVARRGLELRRLGRVARGWAVRQQAVARGGAAPSDVDRRARRPAYRGARTDPALGHARLGVLPL